MTDTSGGMSDSVSDSGLSLTDAAAALGISERTVLRRIKDGTVKGRKIGEGHGGVWRVYLDSVSDIRPAPMVERQTDVPGTLSDSQTTTHGTVSDSMSDGQTRSAPVDVSTMVETAAQAPEALALVHLVDRLQQEKSEMAAAAAHWQARAQAAEQRAQHAEEQVKLLMAPKDEPTPAAATEPKRAWWQVWKWL